MKKIVVLDADEEVVVLMKEEIEEFLRVGSIIAGSFNEYAITLSPAFIRVFSDCSWSIRREDDVIASSSNGHYPQAGVTSLIRLLNEGIKEE